MLASMEAQVTDSHRKRVMVVEDDIQMSKFIQHKLDFLGYEVAGNASNCQQALQLSGRVKPELILMDIMLDGEDDGISTARQIVEKQHVPIVYLTAHEDEVLFQRAQITEPFGYLIKPFNDRDLKIVIETALYRHEQDLRLRKALQEVRDIVNSSVDMMISYDLEGRILEFNKVAEAAFAIKRRAARQLMVSDLVMDDLSRSVLLDGDPSGVYQHERLNFKDHDDHPFEKEVVVSPLQDLNGKIKGRLLVGRAD